MNNTDAKLTAIVQAFFTRCMVNKNGRTYDHYSAGQNIATYKDSPVAELRKYYVMCNKIKASDAFQNAALDSVNWNSLVQLMKLEAVAA